ncbi:MAG: PEP-CTERM sorting domain-containing protein [Porticoccaceae bacterium]|nr:PEP-CTERM sorting domain-containing protein [Porticoccaceae bacterium]
MKKFVMALSSIFLFSNSAFSTPITLVDNRVIIDNSPFYSIGAEDNLGSGNYALNHSRFIDIPYAIFDFGLTTSVTSAILNWDFNQLFGGSPATEFSLYVGSDSSGTITTDDRFMGVLADTSTYFAAEVLNFDITALVNSVLSSGQYVAARFEVTATPDSINGYRGGTFLSPSMEFESELIEPEVFQARGVPEPAGLALLGLGLIGIGFSRRFF